MTAALGKGAEPKVLTESARLRNGKKMKSQCKKHKDIQTPHCVGALVPGPQNKVGAHFPQTGVPFPIFPLAQ